MVHASVCLVSRQKRHWKAPVYRRPHQCVTRDRFPSWMICCDCVVQQRMDCCAHRRCREIFQQAARNGIELPSVGRGFLMLRGARLGLTRKAIAPAAAGRSQAETTIAQTLGATFPRHVAATRSVAQVVVDPDGTLESDEAPVD